MQKMQQTRKYRIETVLFKLAQLVKFVLTLTRGNANWIENRYYSVRCKVQLFLGNYTNLAKLALQTYDGESKIFQQKSYLP